MEDAARWAINNEVASVIIPKAELAIRSQILQDTFALLSVDPRRNRQRQRGLHHRVVGGIVSELNRRKDRCLQVSLAHHHSIDSGLDIEFGIMALLSPE
jgi:hypothetical protein